MERAHSQARVSMVEAPVEGDRVDALLDGVEVAPRLLEVRQCYGTVESATGALVVRVGDRSVKALRALSCLVDPRAGDRVLVALSDESFILAVLAARGPHEQGVTLSVEGDVTLRSKGGKLAMVADEAVSLTSGTKVEVTAPELEVRAMKTSFFSASLSFVGRTLDGQVDRIKVAARTVDRVIDRVSERIRQSFRTIEQIEQVRAGELDIQVQGDVSVTADNAIVSSEKLMKIDGAQVHLG